MNTEKQYLDEQYGRLIEAIEAHDGQAVVQVLGELRDSGHGRIADRLVAVIVTSVLMRAIQQRDLDTISKIFTLDVPKEGQQ